MKNVRVDIITWKEPQQKYKYGIWNVSPKGTHWVAWYIKKDTAYIFDSLGGLFVDQPLENYLRKYVNNVVVNNEIVQDENADSCGEWSLYFLKHIPKMSYEKFLSKFCSDNEYIINNWF